jgi:hypothetical protein
MEPLVYAKADTLTALMRIDAIEEAFEKTGESYETVEDQLQIINVYSEEMNRMVRSSNFRRMRREDQAAAVDAIVEKAEAESDIIEKYLTLNAGIAFKSELAEDGVIEYTVHNLEGFTVEGLCLALSMPGRELLSRKGIRRNSDLVMRSVGLAFVLETEEDIYDGDDVIMPSGTILSIHIPSNGGRSSEAIVDRDDTNMYDEASE